MSLTRRFIQPLALCVIALLVEGIVGFTLPSVQAMPVDDAYAPSLYPVVKWYVSQSEMSATKVQVALEPAWPDASSSLPELPELNATGGQPPTRILAPSIGLDVKVVEMGWRAVRSPNGLVSSEWLVPAQAAGWHKNSAYPGYPGNTVLSGHNNIDGEVFRYISELQSGDEIILFAGDTSYRYQVEQRLILREQGVPLTTRLKNARWIAPTNDIRLTLVSCWPYTGNTHRVIVVAKPVGQ